MFAQRSRAEAAPRGKAAAPPASKPGPAPFDPLYLPLDLSYPGLSKVCEKPPIFVCEDFLSAAECEQLIKVSGPLLQRSKTHAAAGSEATNGRTSLTCHLAKKTAPCPAILAKIQKLTSKPFGHMELPQVARYTDSQRYVEHYDGVDPHTDAGRAFCQNGGQRIATVLMYLNDVLDGGSTFFRRINFEVRPKKGAAVIFFPGFMNGELDTDALHAGMPAVDVKWVSQIWIRQSFREDGQPSSPVSLEEQTIEGPLHEGIYAGHCLSGDDVYEAVMTVDQAKAWLAQHPEALGFTFQHPDRFPREPVRCWFKSRLRVLYHPGAHPWHRPFMPAPPPLPPAPPCSCHKPCAAGVLFAGWWTVSIGRGMD